ARAREQADDVRATFLDLLPGDLHPERLERAAHVLAHRLLVAGGARDPDDVERRLHETFLADGVDDRPVVHRGDTRVHSWKTSRLSSPAAIQPPQRSSRRRAATL